MLKFSQCRLLAYGVALAGCLSLNAQRSVITLFLRPYPASVDQGQELGSYLEQPGKIAKSCVLGLRNNHLAGIIGIYNGFFDVSNGYGQLTFPRVQESNELTILVTDKITPVMMTSTMVHHWEVEPGALARTYKVVRTEDEETGLTYWDIQATAPESTRIPLNTLVLLAKPDHLYLPEGITLTEDSTNLILPDIYVKKGIRTAQHALYLLNFKHFFRPVRFDYKQEGRALLRHIVP